MNIFKTQNKVSEWIRVKEYDIRIHQVIEQKVIVENANIERRVIYIEIECRNPSLTNNLSCRSNQWHLYTEDGYCYDVKSEFGAIMDWGRNTCYSEEQPYFGGERFINSGRNVRGWLAFHIPDDKRAKYIQFLTSPFGTKTADIEIEKEIQSVMPRYVQVG